MTRPIPVTEDRIRELAYRLWLEDGQPRGRSGEHWEKARELLALEAGSEDLADQGEFGAMTSQNERKVPRMRRPGVARKARNLPM